MVPSHVFRGKLLVLSGTPHRRAGKENLAEAWSGSGYDGADHGGRLADQDDRGADALGL